MTLAAIPPVILIVVRGVYFLATMLLFGAAGLRVLLHRRMKLTVPWRARGSLIRLALVAGCAWLALAADAMAGSLDLPVLTQVLTGTLFGQLFLARLAALLALLLVRDDRVTALLAGAALALPAVTSHAAQASPAGFLAIGATLDAIHLLTAGFWIGSLAVLLRLRRAANFIDVLALFSDWAMIAVLLLVMTGFTNTAMVLLGEKGHVAPLYLYVLLAKLALVLGMLGLALANRLRLMDAGGTGAIARNAGIELALGAGAVLLAGALGQLAPTL